MANQVHANWLNEGVKAWNRRRKKVSFYPDLSQLNFSEFLPPDFRDSPKTSRYFEKFDFSDADLSGANLHNLNFAGAKFNRANLDNADLSSSNFSDANFSNASLRNTNLGNSNFEEARFDNNDFSSVNIRQAVFRNAILIANDMSEDMREVLASNDAKVFQSLADFRAAISQLGASLIGETDPSREADKRTKKTKYDVFFGTNREAKFERGKIVDFTHEFTSSISYGVCEVVIPDGHRIGSLGSWEWRKLFSNKSDHLRLESLTSLDEILFWKYVLQRASRMNVKAHPTIFIHGYNTSFEEAVLRTAQIGHDLGLGQGVGLFSWPSKGKKEGYLYDEESAENSRYLLANFISSFIENSNTGKINLIAHSMGCRCLVGALEELHGTKKSALSKINQVIIAAADINSDKMPFQAEKLKNCFKRFTSYACEGDNALGLSSLIHGYNRVGKLPPIFVHDAIDSIITNENALSFWSHDYHASSREVLTDIFQILKNNLEPDVRALLDRHEENGLPYWRMKS